jgi:lysozyme family protein
MMNSAILAQLLTVGAPQELKDEAELNPNKVIQGAIENQKNRLVESVFNSEGGYSTDTKDTGNYVEGKFVGTNHGISAPVLKNYLGRTPTIKDMRSLTKDKAREIYKKDYYEKYGVDKLPSDLQEIVLHGVVNSGGTGLKVAQKLVGVKADGVAGKKTKKALKDANFTKQEYKNKLLEEYKKFKTWKDHGEGWTNRFEHLAQEDPFDM